MSRLLLIGIVLFGHAVPFFHVANADFSDTPVAVPPAPSRPSTVPATEPGLVPTVSTPGKEPNETSRKGHKNSIPQPKNTLTPTQKVDSELSTGVGGHNKNAPVKIKGDRAKFSSEKGLTTIMGNFQLTQDDTTVKADRADVFSAPSKKLLQSADYERAVIKGKVKIQKKAVGSVPALYAEAEEIEYFAKEQRAILKGKPKIWRGGELASVQGEKIELNLVTGETEILDFGGAFDPNSTSIEGPQAPRLAKPKR